ncbi:MAG: class II aldolase/adducin family protein [bacterium]
MDLREELVIYGKKLVEDKLVAGPGGNISAREGDVAYLSPSGFALDSIAPENYVPVDVATGKVLKEGLRPTSEVSFHLAIYRAREDVRAVIHAHPSLLTGLVSGGRKVEPMTPDFVAYIDHVEIIPYIVPTGEELARAVAEAVARCNCIAMVNHGAITVGANLKEAYYRMCILEESCKTQLAAIIAGKPRIFTEKEVQEIRNLAAEAYRRKLLLEGKV